MMLFFKVSLTRTLLRRSPVINQSRITLCKYELRTIEPTAEIVLDLGSNSFEEAIHALPRPRGLHKRIRSRSFATGTGTSRSGSLKREKYAKTTTGIQTRRKHQQGVDSITVRPMDMRDISAIYHLGNSIFTASDLPNLFRTWDDYTVVQNFESSPEFCFVAQANCRSDVEGTVHDESEVIAFLLGDSLTKKTCGTRGYIQWVAVHPDFRRQGIAKSLLNAYISVARQQNISLLLADTPADNLQAIQMFEGVGLSQRKDHVYLTCRLEKDLERQHVDDEGEFAFSYTSKGQKISIRNMQVEDLHPIYLIGERIFTKEYSNIHDFWDEHTVMSSYLSDPEFAVAATIRKENNEEQVVAFAFGTTIEKPRSKWKYGWLVWLGCDSDFQGLGLATQLYNTILELFALERVNMVMIDTQANNHGALGFFRKQGFGQDEEHVYLTNSAEN